MKVILIGLYKSLSPNRQDGNFSENGFNSIIVHKLFIQRNSHVLVDLDSGLWVELLMFAKSEE
jgi:hypothetical protein